MASLASHLSKKLKNFFLITLLTTAAVTSEQQCRNFKSIIIFGDSITDTGNLLHLSDLNNLPQSAFPPYGETFFHVPTGRFSNGRLIIDFIGRWYILSYDLTSPRISGILIFFFFELSRILFYSLALKQSQNILVLLFHSKIE